MNRVYLRGCEAAYLEPLLGAEGFDYCANPAATHDRRLSEDDGRQDAGTTTTTLSFVRTDEGTGASGSALSRTRQSESLRHSRDYDRPQAHRRESTAVGEVSSDERNSNRTPSGHDQVSGVHEDALDGRRRLRAAGETENGSSAGSGPRLNLASSPADNVNDDFHTGMSGVAKRGSAGSLVIHIRSGDIFRPLKPGATPSRSFLTYGQVGV